MNTLLLAAATALADPASLVGLYDGGQTELAARLELRPDGHFRYGLSYGALDEEAEGVWTVEGGQVLLTTEPEVVPPRFDLLSRQAAPTGTLAVMVVDPKDRPLPNIDIAITYDEGDPDIVQSQEQAVTLPLDAARPPRSILLAVPVYDLQSELFPIAEGKGYGFTFRLEPNGLGKADFRRASLTIDKDALVLPRFDRTLRFTRRQ